MWRVGRDEQVRAVSLDYSRSWAAGVGVRWRVALGGTRSPVGCWSTGPLARSRDRRLWTACTNRLVQPPEVLTFWIVGPDARSGVDARGAGTVVAVVLVVRMSVSPHRVQHSCQSTSQRHHGHLFASSFLHFLRPQHQRMVLVVSARSPARLDQHPPQFAGTGL